MTRRKLSQAAIERAIRGASRAGLPVTEVEIDQRTERIRLFVGDRRPTDEDALDRELIEWRAANGEG